MPVTEASSAAMPIRISPNGRYFVDQAGTPFFLLGDTLWHLFRAYAPDEVEAILQNRKSKGFNTVLIMLLGWESASMPNINGDLPFMDSDIGRPNEPYFAHIDRVMRIACDLGFIQICGVYHKSQAQLYTPQKARAFAKWIGNRFKNNTHLIWSMYPEAKHSCLPMIRALAEGLREGTGGRQMITVHPDPSPQSSSFAHSEEWIAFNMLQTCVDIHLVHPMTAADYAMTPIKPAVMAEGGYEAAPYAKMAERVRRKQWTAAGMDVSALGRDAIITTADIRRQAYWTFLAGGHHVYGHDGNHLFPAKWKEWIDSPGSAQIGVFRKVVTGLNKWWELIPDQSIIVDGWGSGTKLNAAARSCAGDWAMVYLSTRCAAMVRMDVIKTSERLTASWINPVDGTKTRIGEFRYEDVREFATPDGWEDAILMMEGM